MSLAIVTGRIPIKRIEFIRNLPFVKSLKGARRVTPALHNTIPDIGANKYAPLPKQTGGKGVLVGIIDFGCDFRAPELYMIKPVKPAF